MKRFVYALGILFLITGILLAGIVSVILWRRSCRIGAAKVKFAQRLLRFS